MSTKLAELSYLTERVYRHSIALGAGDVRVANSLGDLDGRTLVAWLADHNAGRNTK